MAEPHYIMRHRKKKLRNNADASDYIRGTDQSTNVTSEKEPSEINDGSSQDNKDNPYPSVQHEHNDLMEQHDGMDVEKHFENDASNESDSGQSSSGTKQVKKPLLDKMHLRKRGDRQDRHDIVEDSMPQGNVSGQSGSGANQVKPPLEDKGHPKVNWTLWLCLLFMFGMLLLPYLRELWVRDEGSELDTFDERVETLKNQFEGQTPTLWNVIKALGREHIAECANSSLPGPYRPLVFLLLLTNDNSEDLPLCLSKRIAKLFGKDVRYDLLKGSEIARNKLSKADLHDEILRKLSSSESLHTIIFTELESLSYETASVFFKFCDNEDAPYPQAIFIFALTLDEDISFLEKSTRKETTAKARDYLNTVAWKDGDRAKTEDLIAILFNPYPLPIMKEDPSVLRKVCG